MLSPRWDDPEAPDTPAQQPYRRAHLWGGCPPTPDPQVSEWFPHSWRVRIGPAVFEDAFYFVIVPPPPGGSGEGPDCRFPKAIDCFGPIPARKRG